MKMEILQMNVIVRAHILMEAKLMVGKNSKKDIQVIRNIKSKNKKAKGYF